jgi:transcriptional regulator with XRE-family HTH domain
MFEEDDSWEAVGARLKAVREMHSLTRQEMADRLGMSPQGYGAAEKATRRLSLDAAMLLRKEFKLPLEFTYFGNMADLPTRISKHLMSIPHVKSAQKSSE